MDQTALVARLERAGRRLSTALKRDDSLGLTASFWWFDEETQRWSFVVASKHYQTAGPTQMYKKIAKHLAKTTTKRTTGDAIELSQVVVVPDSDRRVRAMASAVRVEDGSVRLQQSVLNGLYVADAIVYELAPPRS